MIHTNRFLGSVLLVAGTSIGAGMLLVPVTCGFSGFFLSSVVLGICWMFMLFSAFLLLDVNLHIEGEPNLVSMAQKTLGSWGKAICWGIYLLLLYSLTTAYISASSPLFLMGIEFVIGRVPPSWIGPLPLLLIFSVFIYLGTRSVDYVNRFLMTGLIVAYLLLVFFLPSHVNYNFLLHMDAKPMFLAIPIAIVAFGFHIIIPTLTTYLCHDPKRLRWIIFIGSSIPLFIYLIWNFLILGTVPLSGEGSLSYSWIKGESATIVLSRILSIRWIGIGVNFFALFAIVTSFLGVSLSLSDFLTDGLKLKRGHLGRGIATILTFFPPLVFVYTYKRGFIVALEFAAIIVALLLGIFPTLMAWTLPAPSIYRKKWMRFLLLLVLAFFLFVIGIDLYEKAGYLRQLITPYIKNVSP